MGNITKRQTLTALRKLQKLQAEDCGKHNISINCYMNEEGRLWFTCNARVCGEFVCCECYEWREYSQTMLLIEDFIEKIRNDG